MSGPYPRLVGGHSITQSIWEVVTTPLTTVGDWGILDDGREFYYARNSGAAAIVAGNVLQSETVSVDMDDLAISAAVLISGTTITVTPVGTKTFAADDLTGGYILSNSGATGQGIAFRIKSNLVTTGGTAFAVELFDGIPVALDSTSKCTVMKNPYMDVVIKASGTAQYNVGASNIAVGAGDSTPQYFWCQASGVAAVSDGDTNTIGIALMGDSAGATVVADGTQQPLGTQLFTGVDGDWSPVALEITI
jgi:hypothetical protein